jgi:hypothetical protein
MRNALSRHKHLCKANVKTLQSDPKHETPHLGRAVPPPYSRSPLLPSTTKSSNETHNVSKKKAWQRSTGSNHSKCGSRS